MRRLVLTLRKEELLSFISPSSACIVMMNHREAPDCIAGAMLCCCQDIGCAELALITLVLLDNSIMSLSLIIHVLGHWAMMKLKSALRRLVSTNHGPHHHSTDLPRCLRAITFRAEDRNYELLSTMLKKILASLIRYIRRSLRKRGSDFPYRKSFITDTRSVACSCLLTPFFLCPPYLGSRRVGELYPPWRMWRSKRTPRRLEGQALKQVHMKTSIDTVLCNLLTHYYCPQT